MAHVVATADYVEKVHKYAVKAAITGAPARTTYYSGTFPQLKQHVSAVSKRWHETYGFPIGVTFEQVA
jgi:hypothetical protein